MSSLYSDKLPATSKNFNPKYVEYNPGLYAAINAGQPSAEDAFQMAEIQYIQAKHAELNNMKDINAARKQFSQLTPAIRENIIKLNPDYDYQSDPSLLKRTTSGAVDAIKNIYKAPFQMVMGTLTALTNTTLRLPYNLNTGMIDAAHKDVKSTGLKSLLEPNIPEVFSYLTTASSWHTAWTGKNNWREVDVQVLDNKHGKGLSALIRGQLDGKKAGDIYREYGGFDYDMQIAISAQSDYNAYLFGVSTNQTEKYPLTPAAKAYQTALADVIATQKDFGNDLTRLMNVVAPPSKVGTIGQIILQSLGTVNWASPGNRKAAFEESKKTDKWVIANPNPFTASKMKTVSPSDLAQFSYELVADPLTWLTGGGTKGLSYGAKLTDQFIKAGKAGVSNEIRVADLFKNERFSSIHQRLVDELNVLRVARTKQDKTAAFLSRERIKQNFPHYDNDITIKHLLNTKVTNKDGIEVNVTDLETLKSFFIRGEMIDYITHGFRNNIGYFNDNHIMIERSTRLITDRLRAKFEGIVNNADVSKPSEVLASGELSKKMQIVKDAFADAGRFPTKLADDPELKATLDALTKHGSVIQKTYNKAMAAHPANVVIHTSDEFVDSSLSAYRDFARILTGDKAMANLMTEVYLGHSPDDRFNMLYSTVKYYLDRIGAPEHYQREILESTFGDVAGFGPVPDFKVPAHLIDDAELRVAPGASQPLHLTRGISMPNFNKIHKDLYDLSGWATNPGLRAVKSLSYSTFANITNGLWSLLLLFPKIAAKGATDEAVLNSLTNSYKSIFAILTRQGAAASNVRAAVTGKEETIGFIKAKLMRDNSPHKFISPAMRAKMQEDVLVKKTITLPNGKQVNVSEWVSADEFFGAPYLDRLVAMGIAKYGGKLSDDAKKYLASELANNSHSMHAHALSSVGRTLGNHEIDGSIVSEMFGTNQLIKALDEAHIAEKTLGGKVRDKLQGTDVLRQTGDFQIRDMAKLSQTQKTVVHYTNFWQYFARNVWTHKPTKVSVDYGDLFIKHNAIRTKEDGKAFVDDVMNQIGFVRNSLGEWKPRKTQLGVEADGTPIITDKISKETIEAFLTDFRQTSQMRLAGLSADQIAEAMIRNSRDELYTIFHGSADDFNEDLLNMVNLKVKEGLARVANQGPYADAIGEGSARAKWAENQAKPSYHISKIAFNEFEDVTVGYGLKSQFVKTDLNFKVFAPKLTVSAIYEKMAKMPWEIMDRQINDLYRTDAYMVKVIENRTRMAPNEKAYAEQLIARGTSPEAAALQADMVFAGQASINAVHGVMKYADNTEVRSQLAWTLRGVGRFNRANEDFWRRMIRLGTTRAPQTAWRLSHYQLAMEGSGFVHTDDDGNKYVILPNDGVVFGTLNNIFTALLNPLNVARAAMDGELDTIFKQPEYNQKTLKLSMLNPSYSDSAGVFSLHGATMSLSVAGLKQLFKVAGFEKQGEELDNLILGPMSDNQTLARILPSALHNIWAGMDPEHKTGAWATAIQQAAMFMQYNDSTKITPEELQDPAKLQKYYDRLGITAYNLIAVKAGFNTLSAVPMGDTTDGVNPLLRDAGIITFTEEFNDILRAVMDKNAEQGYPLSEPIAVAVAMFVGSYPDRLVFTVAKDSLGAKLYVNAVKETKNWVFDNKEMIARYNSAAFVFAPKPQDGEYDPATVRFLQASGIIEPKNSPFVTDKNADTPLMRYIKELAAVKDRAKFYDLDREMNNLLTDPNNPRRNDPAYVAELKAQVAYQKTVLKEGNPMLAYTLGTSEVVTRELLQKNFRDIKFLVSDPDFTSTNGKPQKGKIDPNTQKQIKQMLNIASTMLLVFEDNNIRTQATGIDTLNLVYKDGIENLEKLSLANPYAGMAYQNIIKPLLDDVYRVPTKGLK
jgi:hypothetical protein